MKTLAISVAGAAAIGLGSGLWLCGHAYKAKSLAYEARIVAMAAEQDRLRLAAFEANAKIKEANEKAATIAAQLAAQQVGVIDVEYRTITKYVDRFIDRPVYRNQCIDDDGLRQLNSFIAGGSGGDSNSASDTGESGAAVP